MSIICKVFITICHVKFIKLHKMYYGSNIKTLYDLLSDGAKKKAESLI